jgi:hypothetical protein
MWLCFDSSAVWYRLDMPNSLSLFHSKRSPHEQADGGTDGDVARRDLV